MEDNGRIMAIGAHPDDVEFRCAGTLALLRQKGYEITIVTVANGDCGSTQHHSMEIARIRKAEAAESAAILDGRYFCLDEGDLAFGFDMETRRKVTNAIREIDPFIVFTHHHEDYMAGCPAGVPNVIGSNEGPATNQIEAGGWEVSVNSVQNGGTCTEGVDDKVINQNPTGGFLAPGETVTITMCRWDPPPEEPPADPGL